MGRTSRPGTPARAPPRRWAHVQGVAARARSLAPVPGADADLLHTAAWLNDIGYAPGLAVTGLHALDGARYLRDAQHADALLCRLVAHHSYAIVEAGERGLANVLGLEFEPAPYTLSSVLTCCDMTTSPDGELVPVERRLAEIHHRYGPGHLVSRSIQRATPMILEQSSRSITEPPEPHISTDWKRAEACTPELTWAPEWPPRLVRSVRIISLSWSPVTESNRRPSPYHACRFCLMTSQLVGLPQTRQLPVSGCVAHRLLPPEVVVTWFVTGSRPQFLRQQGIEHKVPPILRPGAVASLSPGSWPLRSADRQESFGWYRNGRFPAVKRPFACSELAAPGIRVGCSLPAPG
jgi:hypothetical protein